jgi:glutathione S-transferase
MAESSITLVFLPVSPYSERARWALDHHGIAYRELVHQPFLGEWRLRRLLASLPGERATVPALLTSEGALKSSWDIANYTDRIGKAAPLIPAEQAKAIKSLTARVDNAAEAGRILVSARLLAHPAALDESLPATIPHFMRPWLRPMTRYGMRWFMRKYELDTATMDANQAEFSKILESFEVELSRGRYLLGSFSFADIALATLLQSIAPVADRYIPIGPALRRAWSDPTLATRFARLVTWRDRLYEAHRQPAVPAPAAAATDSAGQNSAA